MVLDGKFFYLLHLDFKSSRAERNDQKPVNIGHYAGYLLAKRVKPMLIYGRTSEGRLSVNLKFRNKAK